MWIARLKEGLADLAGLVPVLSVGEVGKAPSQALAGSTDSRNVCSTECEKPQTAVSLIRWLDFFLDGDFLSLQQQAKWYTHWWAGSWSQVLLALRAVPQKPLIAPAQLLGKTR